MALSLSVVTAIYVIGLQRRQLPVLNINPSLEVATLVLVGSVMTLLGFITWTAIFARRSTATVQYTTPDLLGERALTTIVIAGIVAGIANYATGTIPLLQANIDSARFASDDGLFGRAWPLIIAALQISIVCAATNAIRNRWNRLSASLAIFSLIILVLSGARALIGIPLIAVAFIYIELRRPSILKVLGALLAGLMLFGIAGRLRLGTAVTPDAEVYLKSRGLDGWFGSLDLSLQTGPRVFTRVANTGIHANGSFLFGDLGSFLKLGFSLSDRYVNEILQAGSAQLGGLPPTLFGGFYLDWGWPGVVIMSILLGVVCAATFAWAKRRPGLGSYLWFGYFAAYLVTSSYSYISAKPTWIVVLLVAVFIDSRSTQQGNYTLKKMTRSRGAPSSPERIKMESHKW
jgi:oligosaccharide repeat unit polymerase